MSGEIILCGRFVVPSDINTARAKLIERGLSPDAALVALYLLGHPEAKKLVETAMPMLVGEEEAKRRLETAYSELESKLELPRLALYNCETLGSAITSKMGVFEKLIEVDIYATITRLKIAEKISFEATIDKIITDDINVRLLTSSIVVGANVPISIIGQSISQLIDILLGKKKKNRQTTSKEEREPSDDEEVEVYDDTLEMLKSVVLERIAGATIEIDHPKLGSGRRIIINPSLSEVFPGMVTDAAVVVGVGIAVRTLLGFLGIENRVRIRRIVAVGRFVLQQENMNGQSVVVASDATRETLKNLVLTSIATSDKTICVKVDGESLSKLEEARRTISSTETGITYVIGVGNGKLYIPKIFVTRILSRKIETVLRTDPDMLLSTVGRVVKIGRATYYEVPVGPVEPEDVCARVVEAVRQEDTVDALKSMVN